MPIQILFKTSKISRSAKLHSVQLINRNLTQPHQVLTISRGTHPFLHYMASSNHGAVPFAVGVGVCLVQVISYV